MNVHIAIVNAFTYRGRGGNPAGVVLDAGALDPEQKLDIARAVGLSETAFVSPSEIAEFRLEFFTPTRQIAHCGHATVATFAHLARQGRLEHAASSKETIDGTRRIVLDGETVFMEQLAPRYRDVPARELADDILPALGLEVDALDPRAVPAYVNTGNAFLVLPLAARRTLAGIQPDLEAIHRISDRHDLIGFYPFTLDVEDGFDAEARMFAPRYGIAEEAATGMAAGPLAAFLHDRLRAALNHSRRRLRILQGALMPRPSASEIIVDLAIDETGITGLLAGGQATLMEERELTLQPGA